MQHMPDKDFDNLFREKFMDAEIEPSANLWAKIENEITPKRKRVLPLYWMAAASVLVVISATFLMQKSEKIQLHGNGLAISMPEVQSPVQSTETTVTVQEELPAHDGAMVKSATTPVVAYQSKSTELKNTEPVMQPIVQDERLPIKQADPRPVDLQPVREATQESPVVIAQVKPVAAPESNTVTEADYTTEKKSIRNVGDLVNYVVDKVDKRDKKLLRFNTDDDDNSSIVGINIGFLKLNKKNKDR